MSSAGPEYQFSREVRFGVVLYGGVSLAVYINGVAQEMFRAVRGHGLYGLAKLLTDSDVVIDVISGTSAGGLNGLYLGYCLVSPRSCNFLRFSNLWREQGDINLLLRKPSKEVERKQSLLDGEGYYQDRLFEAFGDLDRSAPLTTPFASKVHELDLFVTGTDIAGEVSTRLDDQGAPITVKEHRTVFRLKHREGRFTDFEPVEIAQRAMAKLARITSCFPVAFPPVRVSPEAPDHDPDSLLARWGRLRAKNLTAERVYLDGGVLDNKPFSHTLNAIFRRTSERAVRRTLFYVEPVPELFLDNQPTESPNVLQSAILATLEIPRYESISGDYENVVERNKRIEQMERILGAARDSGQRAGDEAPTLSPLQTRIYENARASHLIDRIMEGALRENGRNAPLEGGRRERVRSLTEDFFARWTGGEGSSQLLSQLEPCDVYFRLRRLFQVTYDLVQRPLIYCADPESAVPYRATPVGETMRRVNRLVQLHEILAHQLELLVDNIDVGWDDEGRSPGAWWSLIQNCFHRFIPPDPELTAILARGDGFLSQAQLDAIYATLSRRRREISALTATREGRDQLTGLPDMEFRSLLHWIDETWSIPCVQETPEALAAWHAFPYLDAIRLPLQVTAGFGELDRIRIVRISPNDSQAGFAYRAAHRKLAGAQFSNFGGFFKKAWRSNDVLWGRVDGIGKLMEEILEPARISALVGDPAFRATLRQRLRTHLDSFVAAFQDPQSRNDAQQACALCLDLASDDAEVRRRALGRIPELRLLLIRAEQRQIIRDTWPEVLEDSIAEMLAWNRVSVDDDQGNPAPVFQVQRMRFDRNITANAAAAFAKWGLQDLLNRKTIDDVFDDHYKVGEERILQTLPPPILVETGARALLVMRDCLLGALGDRAGLVRAAPLFKLGFDYPVRTMYAFARMGRHAPEWARMSVYALLSAGAVALVLLGFVAFHLGGPQKWMVGPVLLAAAALVTGVTVRKIVLRRVSS